MSVSAGKTGRANALIDRLRQDHGARQSQTPPPPTPVPELDAKQAKGFDFSRLPHYAQLRIQRAVGEKIGVGSPFFRRIDEIDGAEVTIGNRRCIQFGSYNYVGLNRHPELVEAVQQAAADWGISASASRLVGGERPYHAALERAIAEFLGTEDAIAMVSGHATNVTSIGALLGPKDLILVDQLIHNSVSEGARLSGATRLTFPHNDWAWVDEKLSRLRGRYDRVLIVIEGLYSMDGDAPDLEKFVAVKARHDAWLMVDEAHALGVMGETGRGIAEAQGIDPQVVEIWMGTLSKTLCSCGGFIAGSAALIEYLRHKAAGFVFSVGLSAPHAVAAETALRLLDREPERVARLRQNGQRFLEGARAAGLDTGLSEGLAVTPVIIGDSIRTVLAADRVFEEGVNALPIIFPAVPEKQARLRFFITSEHTEAQIDHAVEVTARVVRQLLAENPADWMSQPG
ncbi:MAG: aminotransferase class I/II-fold pyridoxal phosphate-dependent enzyme [Pseudomonadota bacterium]